MTSAPRPAPRHIFVSYAHEDAWFVSLLVELLAHHHLKPWHDRHDIAPAASLSRSVSQGLQTTDALLVVMSPHALTSRWVRDEVLVFARSRPDPFLVPLLIAPCDTSALLPELADRLHVDFTASHLHGYQSLMRTMGRNFLPATEQRHNGADRRTGRVTDRLTVAFARRVRQHAGLALHEAIPYEDEARLLESLLDGFYAELCHGFRLLDTDGHAVKLSRDGFLRMAFTSLEQSMTSALDRLVPQFMIACVVDLLTGVFRVESRDRREERMEV